MQYSHGTGYILFGNNFEMIETKSVGPLALISHNWELKGAFFGFIVLSLAALGWFVGRSCLKKD